MRKILVSGGFGAGWSSWMYSIPTRFACEYQPIIEALEKGENLFGDNKDTYNCSEKNTILLFSNSLKIVKKYIMKVLI